MQTTALLIFPHQLFKHNPLFAETGSFYLIEEFLFFNQYAFHKQKICFHRASLKCYENYLIEKGYPVTYIEATQPESDIRILIGQLQTKGIQSIVLVDPVDDWLLTRITQLCTQLTIQLKVIDSPSFLNSTKEVSEYFNVSKKKFFQTDFYKQQRIKRKLLLDASGAPVGNQWSFDGDNRLKYPKGKQVPQITFPEVSPYETEAQQYTLRHFTNNPGELHGTLRYPIGFEASEQWLKQFLHNRLAEFGAYEDAIVAREFILHHSVLTPMLNTGMLTPQDILDSTLLHAQTHEIPINSLEGFVRQVVGWREFIRGVYQAKGRAERTRNYWGFTRKIPKSFYDGTTGIVPIDETIRKVLQTGYCHHIERLMVLGNFMLLCEFDPDEVYRWFMELFIDAYDWVMVPNVYGMSQFADGGLMATKPYISGSNYLMKMSDYPKGDWQPIWDALFWRFMFVHRDFFLQNPRLGMLVRTFDKWTPEKQQEVLQRADVYLETLD